MEHIIIGTAGHIDHGKTALIKALTGRETDCLKEEKKRGISIDLGFTWFDLKNGNRAGIIDVPGHEKFLPNMLSGVCGMDLVLLVIALDEGIMPQTREHMEILEELDIPSGIIVLTKADCVDPEWAEMMEEEIKSQLQESRFKNWPAIKVSAIKGTGILELKDMIASKASVVQRNRLTEGAFRMPVDRVMSLKGIGTIIAGTVLEGTIYVGDELTIYPEGKKVRIRSMQIHGSEAEKAQAGQRAAMNVVGIEKSELKRGMVAASADSLRLADRLDAKIHISDETERIIKNQSRFHLHIGAAEILCRMIMLENQELHAGEEAYVQLVLETPIAVKKKDRFILRFYSPLETIGGGIVLDERADRHKRFDKDVLNYLRRKEEDKDEEILLIAINEQKEKPIEKKELVSSVRIPEAILTEHLSEMKEKKNCIEIAGKKRNFYWSYEAEMDTWERLKAYLEKYHKERKYSRGCGKAVFKSNTLKKWEPDRFDAYLSYLEKADKLKIDGDLISLSGFVVYIDSKTEKFCGYLKRTLHKAGYDFVACKTLKPKDMDELTYKELLEYLAEEGRIVKISDEFFTVPELAEQLKKQVYEYFEKEEIISFASLRDLLGTSRRSAKPLMAYLDEQKITSWCGKETERKKYQER